jgi:hypothetical protein
LIGDIFCCFDTSKFDQTCKRKRLIDETRPAPLTIASFAQRFTDQIGSTCITLGSNDVGLASLFSLSMVKQHENERGVVHYFLDEKSLFFCVLLSHLFQFNSAGEFWSKTQMGLKENIERPHLPLCLFLTIEISSSNKPN